MIGGACPLLGKRVMCCQLDVTDRQPPSCTGRLAEGLRLCCRFAATTAPCVCGDGGLCGPAECSGGTGCARRGGTIAESMRPRSLMRTHTRYTCMRPVGGRSSSKRRRLCICVSRVPGRTAMLLPGAGHTSGVSRGRGCRGTAWACVADLCIIIGAMIGGRVSMDDPSVGRGRASETGEAGAVWGAGGRAPRVSVHPRSGLAPGWLAGAAHAFVSVGWVSRRRSCGVRRAPRMCHSFESAHVCTSPVTR